MQALHINTSAVQTVTSVSRNHSNFMQSLSFLYSRFTSPTITACVMSYSIKQRNTFITAEANVVCSTTVPVGMKPHLNPNLCGREVSE